MVNFVGKLCLAPMVRSGELPTRLMALSHGADLVWSPEIIDKKIVQTTRVVNSALNSIDYVVEQPNNSKKAGKPSLVFRTVPSLERGKLIFQMGSADPACAVAAALKVIEDVDGIDLNCGCPKPFSTHAGMGAALLQTPDLLCDILTALVTKVGKPHQKSISCKIRVLDSLESTMSLVEKICATGIENLTIHCRTRDMRNRQDPRWKYLPTLIPYIQGQGVSVVINGNLQSRQDVQSMREILGNPNIGGMMAEAAEANPSVFSDSPIMAKEAVLQFLDLAHRYQPENISNTKFMLLNMTPGRSSFYQKFARAKSFEAFYTVAEQLRSEPDDAISKYLVKDCQKQRLMDADQYRSFISHERVEEMKLALSRSPSDIDKGDLIKQQEQQAAAARKRVRESEDPEGERKKHRQPEVPCK
ncbi:tRNA-dihydrouridine(20) synthase [NAD(P)+] [Diutina catenulata]